MGFDIVRRFISLLIFTLALAGCAGFGRDKPEPYLGQFVHRYSTGDVYRFDVKDATSLSWQCLAGAERGHSGQEQTERFKVADGIYFVAWIEQNGATITQVLNFNSNEVYTTAVHNETSSLLSGTIEREAAPDAPAR